jgi:hypothetical protein
MFTAASSPKPRVFTGGAMDLAQSEVLPSSHFAIALKL